MKGPAKTSAYVEATQAGMDGSKLSEKSARSLEAELKAQPDNLTTRSKLLGYYWIRAHSSEDARSAHQHHLLWLIRNHPEAPILRTPYHWAAQDESAYEEGRAAWFEQLRRRPRNTTLLGSAAGYLLLVDPETAEKLYTRAEKAAPRNHMWPEQLSRLYDLRVASSTGEQRTNAALEALSAYERCLSRVKDDRFREALLCSVVSTAFEAGEYSRAQDYAEQVLFRAENANKEHWNYGNMVHHANQVLGRIALQNGDIDHAKERLLAAGDTPGSPQLDSFGQNMTLAKELLEIGEHVVVLEYFRRCGVFWKEEMLDRWSTEVGEGRTPDFRANLNY